MGLKKFLNIGLGNDFMDMTLETKILKANDIKL